MTSMNSSDASIGEQLSAWMDGELSKEEALFLERRMQHDEALQAMYSRLQMSSACMKGQSARLMPHTLCTNIRQALADEVFVGKSRKPLFAWAAAASMAFAAIVFIPGMMQGSNAPAPKFAVNNEIPASAEVAATFASADLVANSTNAVSTSLVATSAAPVIEVKPATAEPGIKTIASVESPENFPLNVSSEKKSWPRSPVNANSDPALEAYLVRHNQMMAQDGMGGFVPYVDVVAQDAEQTETKTSTNAGEVK